MSSAMLITVLAVAVLLSAGCSSGEGEALFRENCSSCHPGGGNISRGDKGLKRDDLLRNNIRNAEDIVAYLRRPGPDMPTFTEQSLPHKDAVLLAEYILQNRW